MSNNSVKVMSKDSYGAVRFLHWSALLTMQAPLFYVFYRSETLGHLTPSDGFAGFILLASQYLTIRWHWHIQTFKSLAIHLVIGTLLVSCISFYWSVLAIMCDLAVIALVALSVTTQRKLTHLQPRIERGTTGRENNGHVRYIAHRIKGGLDSILGMQEMKSRLIDAVLEINNAKRDANVRNGILFTGEPGNGKTSFANAIAGEFKLPIISVSVGDLASKWVNETTENVKKLFNDAKMQAPCVLFMDEVDSLIGNRSSEHSSNSENRNVVNTLLKECVDIRGTGVILIAATNYLDHLDPAAIREGRFDYKIEIPNPDLDARIGLIKKLLSEAAIQVEHPIILSAAKRWEGFSSKRVLAICQELVTSRKNTTGVVELKDFMNALRCLQGRKGYVPENTKSLADLFLPESTRRKVIGLSIRMKDIEKIEESGGSVPNGVIMSGPPGTGKSSLATSLAKETGWAFITTTGADLMKPEAIDKLMSTAKELRPVIIFIDEADDLLQNREMSHVTTYTNKLLTAMSGVTGKIPDVLFMAATNHPEQIDSAALRPGRFTEKIVMDLPDKLGRIQYIQNWLTKSKVNFATNLDAEALVEMMGECSIPTLDAVLQEAINNMLVNASMESSNNRPVRKQDVAEAIRTVMG